MEHNPWIGPEYDSGVAGRRVAIVGYSHWGQPGEEDSADCTIGVVTNVISGTYKIAFFTSIRNYFGYESDSEFWNCVIFFNFLPDMVGVADERYASGTNDQIVRGQARFLRVISERSPDVVFVFTRKGWYQLQPAMMEQPNVLLTGLDNGSFTLAKLNGASHSIRIAGLRHPERANGDQMRRVVSTVLAS